MKRRLIKKLLKLTFLSRYSYDYIIIKEYWRTKRLKEILKFRLWTFKNFKEYSRRYRKRKKKFNIKKKYYKKLNERNNYLLLKKIWFALRILSIKK
jgi:hypothetical protein